MGLLFLLIAIFIYMVSSSTGENNDNQTEHYIEEAIRRASFQCYASEGSFPPDMEYIQKNYGIMFDSDDYIVDYQSRGGNLPPDIFVSKKGKNWKWKLQIKNIDFIPF